MILRNGAHTKISSRSSNLESMASNDGDLSSPMLEDQIFSSFVFSVFPEDRKQRFWPEGSVERIITRRSIINKLWFDGDKPVPDEDREISPAQNDLIGFILTSAKKIFTVSLIINLSNDQLKTAMVHFKENGVVDSQLPFDIPLDGTPHPHFQPPLWN